MATDSKDLVVLPRVQQTRDAIDVVSLRQIVEMAMASAPQPPTRNMLQRSYDRFVGWFGPGIPIPTIAPKDTDPRQWDFQTTTNLQNRVRAQERVSVTELRQLANWCSLARVAIETRKSQLDRFGWTIRPRNADASQEDIDKDAGIKRITEALQVPDRRRPFKTWLRSLLEDMFVLDAPAVYLRPNDTGDGIYSLEQLDGGTIMPIIGLDGRAPIDGSPAYRQIIKGMPAVDFGFDELIYMPRNPRVDHLYGFSPIEQIMLTVNLAIRRETAQLEYYTAGNIPDVFVPCPPEWTLQQMTEAQVWWDARRGQSDLKRGVTLVPSQDIREMRQPPLKDEFDEWLSRLIMYAFDLPPTQFVSVGMNRATAETVANTATDEGLIPLMLWIEDFMSRILAVGFKRPDLVFKWQEVKTADPEKVSKIAQVYINAGVKTTNEVRAELGMSGIEGGDIAYIMTAGGPFPVAFLGKVPPPGSVPGETGPLDENGKPTLPSPTRPSNAPVLDGTPGVPTRPKAPRSMPKTASSPDSGSDSSGDTSGGASMAAADGGEPLVISAAWRDVARGIAAGVGEPAPRRTRRHGA